MRSTIQLSELSSLFDQVPMNAPANAYREAVVDENRLGRKGAFMRGEIYKRLNAAYRLNSAEPAFVTFRWLWSLNPAARPLLALQRAWEDDMLLQGASRHVLQVPVGAAIELGPVIKRLKPAIGDSTFNRVVSHLGGTLSQGGLARRKPLERRRPPVAVENLAYAVLSAYTRGIRGKAILTTDEVALLDRDPTVVIELLRLAHSRGWLDYRDSGNVTVLTPLEPLTHVRT